MSRKPDAMHLLAMARPASLDRGSRISADDMLSMATAEGPGKPSRPGRTRLWAPLATAAIVALVFALVTNLAPAPAVLMPPRINQELYDLADRIEKLPARRGAYWRDVEIVGNRVSTGEYTLMMGGRRETWQPRDPADPMFMQTWRQYSARMATATDERGWRAVGAPDRVKGPCDGGGSCGSIPIIDEPQDCRYSSYVDSSGTFPDHTIGTFTMADLAAIPTDPAKLMRQIHTNRKIWSGRDFTEPFAKFLPVTANLLGMPLSPAQRAAVIRMLADLPTTKVVGTATDPLGRRGISVDFDLTAENSNEQVYHRQILDPATGETLSNVSYAARTALGAAKGEVVGYTARGPESGWTGPPASPPKGCKKEK